MIRRFLGTVALVLVAALAAGCGGGSSGAGEGPVDTTVVLSSTTIATAAPTAAPNGATGATTTQLKAPEGVPQKALDVLIVIDRTGAAPEGYVGGTTFQNREKRLPLKTTDGKAIKYREWDVNIKRRNVDRGPQRLVTGDDRSAYYTGDHYATFVRIR